MTRFGISNVSAVALIAVAAVISFFSNPAIFIYGVIAVAIVHQSLYIRGMFSEKSDYFFKSVRGKEYFGGKPGILFRFDDGPDPQVTPKVLDILKKEKVRAMFALIGRNAEKYPDIVRRISQEGHVIGNHTYSHPYNILLMRSKKIKNDVSKANSVIQNITGEPVSYFCPPIGHKNPAIAKAVRELGMTPVMWDIRTFDTRASAGQIISRMKKKLRSPAIILMHDGIEPWGQKDRNSTLSALSKMIGFMREKGLI